MAKEKEENQNTEQDYNARIEAFITSEKYQELDDSSKQKSLDNFYNGVTVPYIESQGFEVKPEYQDEFMTKYFIEKKNPSKMVQELQIQVDSQHSNLEEKVDFQSQVSLWTLGIVSVLLVLKIVNWVKKLLKK